MKKILTFILSITILFSFTISLSGCKDKNENVLACGIMPIKFFVEEVVKDKFEVVEAVKSGQSPETYSPTPKDIVNLGKAKIYFSTELESERVNFIPKFTNKTEVVNLVEYAISSGNNPLYYDDKEMDYHTFLSIDFCISYVKCIKEKVSSIDSKNSSFYSENAENLINRLQNLKEKTQKEYKDLFENFSNSIREVIVDHPAFSYYFNDYNLKMYAMEEEGKELTIDRRVMLINLARDKNIKTIFYQRENGVSLASSLAKELKISVKELKPLEYNFIDNYNNITKLIIEEIKRDNG